MSQPTLDEKMIRLERKVSFASGAEKAQLEKQLSALLSKKKASEIDATEQNDDMFDNMPV